MRAIVHLYFIDIYFADIWLFVIFSCTNLHPVSVCGNCGDKIATHCCETCNFFQRRFLGFKLMAYYEPAYWFHNTESIYFVVISCELFIFSIIIIHILHLNSSLFLWYFSALCFDCNLLKIRIPSQGTSNSLNHVLEFSSCHPLHAHKSID